jgi:hypothetical protein
MVTCCANYWGSQMIKDLDICWGSLQTAEDGFGETSGCVGAGCSCGVRGVGVMRVVCLGCVLGVELLDGCGYGLRGWGVGLAM